MPRLAQFQVTSEDRCLEAVMTRTLEPLPDGTSHGTFRRMAQAVGLDHTTVHSIWSQHGLASTAVASSSP